MSNIDFEITELFAIDHNVVGITRLLPLRIVYRQFAAIHVQVAAKIARGKKLKFRGRRFDRNAIRLSAY